MQPNIGLTCCFHFDDCGIDEAIKVEYNNPSTLIANGAKFRDGDISVLLSGLWTLVSQLLSYSSSRQSTANLDL